MNLGKVKHEKAVTSSKNELQELLEMHDLILSREDLKSLYEKEMNEFASGITLLAIKAIIDSEIEKKCGKPHKRSSEIKFYRHSK